MNPADPVAYVLSLNLHRRHLTQSQRAMIGAKAVEVYEILAKQRRDKGLEFGRGKSGSAQECADPSGFHGRASQQAGEAIGVSSRMVEKGKSVLTHGTPEVIHAVMVENLPQSSGDTGKEGSRAKRCGKSATPLKR